MLFHDVCERSRREEIFLTQAQYLALGEIVVRVKHARDVLSRVFSSRSAREIAVVECGKVKFLRGFRLPKAQSTDVFGVVADHGHIVRHGVYCHIGVAHLYSFLAAAHRPRIAEARPIVRFFALKSVNYLLLEKPVFVAYTVAVERKIVRGGRVEEAGGKSAKTAVSQRSVLYLFKVAERAARRFGKPRAKQVVVDGSARQKFH